MEASKTFTFKNLEHFISEIEMVPRERRGSSSKQDRDFSGTDSVEEAISIARHGYELERLKLQVDVDKFSGRDIIVQHQLSGAVVDIGNFVCGIPENMIDFPIEDNTSFHDIIIDVGELCAVSNQILSWKGIVAAHIIDQLESSGSRVRVIAASMQYFRSEHLAPVNTMVVIKDYHEPLSLGQLAGCLHAGFFRRLMFLFWEGLYPKDMLYNNGYGRQRENRTGIEKALFELGESNAIVLPNMEASRSMGYTKRLSNLGDLFEWADYFTGKPVINGKFTGF